jgi:hypothetical protein
MINLIQIVALANLTKIHLTKTFVLHIQLYLICLKMGSFTKRKLGLVRILENSISK